jgi:peptide/nickel transport system permease protein
VRHFVPRLLAAALLLAAASLITFWALDTLPGDYATALRLDASVSASRIGILQESLPADTTFAARYFDWLRSFADGSWGRSLVYDQAVRPILVQRLNATLAIVLPSLAAAWLAALACAAALWASPRPVLRGLLNGASYGFLAIPDLVLSLSLAWIFALVGRDFSVAPAPHLALFLALLPSLFLQVQSAVSQAAGAPYLDHARSHGLGLRIRFLRYLLPAAATALAAHAGLSLGNAFTTSFLIEYTMGYPGMGPLFLEAIHSRDLQLAAAAVLLSTAVWIVSTQSAALLHTLADPRLRRPA